MRAEKSILSTSHDAGIPDSMPENMTSGSEGNEHPVDVVTNPEPSQDGRSDLMS